MKKLFIFLILISASAFSETIHDTSDVMNVKLKTKDGVVINSGLLSDTCSNYPDLSTQLRSRVKSEIESAPSSDDVKTFDKIDPAEKAGVVIDVTIKQRIVAARAAWEALQNKPHASRVESIRIGDITFGNP